MNCADLKERLAAFASGEPDADVSAHLGGCRACLDDVAGMRATLRAVADLAPAPVDELFRVRMSRDTRAALRQHARAARRRQRTLIFGVMAACAAIAFAWRVWPGAEPHVDTQPPAVAQSAPAQPPRELAQPKPAVDALRLEMLEDLEDLDERQVAAILALLDDEEAEDDGLGDTRAIEWIEALPDDHARRAIEAL